MRQYQGGGLVDTAPRATLVPPPAPRATLVAPPPAPGQTPAVTTGPANYTALGPNMSGMATNFGHDLKGNPDQYMLKTLGPSSRIGAFGADVTDPKTVGVSLPIKTIQDNIGNYRKDPQIRKDIASGRYQVLVNASNGNSGQFKIVDVGPGPDEPGKIDMTGSAMNQLGMTGNANVGFQIIDTATGQVKPVQAYQGGGLVAKAKAPEPDLGAGQPTPSDASASTFEPQTQQFAGPAVAAPPLPAPTGPPPGMAPGLGTVGGAPTATPKTPTPPVAAATREIAPGKAVSDERPFTPQESDKPQRSFTPQESDKPVSEKPTDQPATTQQRPFTPQESDKPVEPQKAPADQIKPKQPAEEVKPAPQEPAEPAKPSLDQVKSFFQANQIPFDANNVTFDDQNGEVRVKQPGYPTHIYPYSQIAGKSGAVAEAPTEGTKPEAEAPKEPAGLPELQKMRSPFAKELENPAVRQRVMASIMAEVGGQGGAARVAYIESIMNRALARNKSLWDTVSQSAYYDPRTIAKLGETYSAATQAELDREITSVLAGSNISNFATGNGTGPYLAYQAGGERFVHEVPDLKWIKARTGGATALSESIAKSGALEGGGGGAGPSAAPAGPAGLPGPMIGLPSGRGGLRTIATEGDQGGGGGGGGGGPGAPVGEPAPSPMGEVSIGGGFGDAMAGAVVGSMLGRPKIAPAEEADPQAAMVKALIQRGYTPQEAKAFAQSSQAVIPHAPLGGQPPPAPGAQPQLPAPAPSLLGPIKVAPVKAPAALVPQGPDPTVVKGLMKQGFTREQAEALAAKAVVSKPGAAAITSGATFRPPAQAPAPARPGQPPAAPGGAQPPPARPAQAPPQAGPQPSEIAAGIRPAGSTRGVANPSTRGSIAGLLTQGKSGLAQAQKEHAEALSPDDPRVKKQPDGYIKGEHFVPGDEFHEHLIGGLPGGHGGRQRQILGEAEQAISDDRPMHFSYISAPKEAARYPTRESRTVQYEAHSPEARLMGTTEGQLVGHSIIPVAAGVKLPTKAGEPHESYIQGLSTNIMANNFRHLNEKLTTMGRKTPYPELSQKFIGDLEGYVHNLNAGRTGTGQGFQAGTEAHPVEPDLDYAPHHLTRHEADFINTVINNTGAFAKHEDAQALRELARAHGTLITPEGETNRMRHDIEQHEPGWRHRVLEPSIRSFKTGLIHEIHPTEEHMPETIRPGREHYELTRAIGRTLHRGRPDVAIAASLHHNLQHNANINSIERAFSEGKITEEHAREALRGLGEDPDEYRYIQGSGGLLTPYEENPEAITPEEHTELKTNLRKQWISGKMDVENYRRKAAEVPLPEIASRKPTPTTSEEPKEPLAPVTPPKPKPPSPTKPPAEPEEEPEEPTPPVSAPKPAPKAPKKAPVAPQQPPEAPIKVKTAEPEESEPEPAPSRKLPGPQATKVPSPKAIKTPEPEETPETAAPEEPPPAPTGAPKKKGAKSKEQTEAEAEDMRQAAIDRDNISPEDASKLTRIQKLAKSWIKKNPIMHGLSMHAYLTGQKKFPGKLNKEGIGEHFDATNPKLDYSKDEHRQQAADAVLHDVMHSLAGTTTGKPSTAYGWYDRTVRKSLNKTGEIAPKILTDPDHALAWKLALAITSQGQDVFPNAESAWHIYRHWHQHGEMPTSRSVFGGGTKAEAMEANLAKVNDLWKEHGTEGLHKILMSRMTSRELKQKYGLDSGEKADFVVNGAMGLGPKIGAFFSNLNGDFDPTTVDLWFSRNMNLMAGNMFGFSDKATRQDRMEKGEVVKSHLSELKDLLESGMVSNVGRERAAKMADELGKLQAHPEGQLDRKTAKELAPEIYSWAREQHKSYGSGQRSYHPDFKTPENVAGKKLDEGVTQLSDDPRTTTERDHWRDIMARADQSLKAAKVHLTNADKQALLWFNIKDLFKMAGSPQKAKADYLDAAHRLVRKVKSGELPGLQGKMALAA